MKIRTTYVHPPIPDRDYDWCAIDTDTYEGGSPIGYGASEGEAIGDLLTQIVEAEVKAEPGLAANRDIL